MPSLTSAVVAEGVTIGDNVELGVGEEAPNVYKPGIYSFGLVTIGENAVILLQCKSRQKYSHSRSYHFLDDYPGGILESGGVILDKKEGEKS